jgi:serine/threonine protein kinase
VYRIVKPSDPTQPASPADEPRATEPDAERAHTADSRQPFRSGDDATELPTTDIDSDPDPEAEEVLRAVAFSPPRRPRSAVVPGTQWGESGRYAIERRLGRGGMGTVYAATDTVLKRIVALKILDAADADQMSAHHARLLREAQLAARVEHERIARVYDVGAFDGFAFVAMEYVPGGTLRQWMTGRAVPLAQTLDIAIQIAEGLAELHGRGVVHRDLKPENVMLTAQGGIKLLDFGLARVGVVPGDEPGGSPRVGAAGAPGSGEGGSIAAAGGTPGYMAPEQYSGQPIDARVDVFALGVIIYELATGQRLFQGATARVLMTATLVGAPPPGDAAWTAVPEPLRAPTARMLALDPRARFSDGARVLAALRELVPEGATPRSLAALRAPNAPDIDATDREVLRQPPGVARRWWTPRIAVATAAAALVAIQAGRWWRHTGEPPAPPGMVRIQGGALEVGRRVDEIERECRDIGSGCDLEQMKREIPRVRVAVAPFFLDRDEVTNDEFAQLLNDYRGTLVVTDDEEYHRPRFVRRNTGAGETDVLYDLNDENGGSIDYVDHREYRVRAGKGRLPAAQMSWYGANLYCESHGKRLPTENEWEAAARGTGDRRFPWGSAPPRCGDVVVPNDGEVPMTGDCPRGNQVSPRIVGSASQDASPDGIRDLAGNVSEWTASTYVEGNRAPGPGLPHDAPRVLRGGSWAESLRARTSGRGKLPPSVMGANIGFRCASSANAPGADDGRP